MSPPDPEPAPHGAILRANLDDPRFATPTEAPTNREWTAADAVIAELTEPLEDAELMLRSEISLNIRFVWLLIDVFTAPIRAFLGLLQR
jgi:hypothetical protein